ncbi:MAG TPA: potassium transporter KefA [Lachnospiraceae bacterium]|nr:potassium transporter KefA [Lachnospiraceae bacterium]
MNYAMIRYLLACVMGFEALFLFLPCLVSIIYQEETGWAFFVTLVLCSMLWFIGTRKKPKSKVFFAKEGFVAVALSWIALSVMGAIPFFLSREIPSFIDAFFEAVSGFSTTGASVLDDVSALSYTTIFWRSFTLWIGGMGVLVFMVAILPLSGSYNVLLMRAESPGPSVGKLVPKVRTTAKLLYEIYFCLTVIQIILLLLGGVPLFDALIISFGTAGTGGFGSKTGSLEEYSSYVQGVTIVFMILFGINFRVYYLILVKQWKQAFRCEEMWYYLAIIAFAILVITVDIRSMFSSWTSAFHHSAFQVSSIITTTAYSTVDFDRWPSFSKELLIVLMFIGSCAGSTGGGIKVSRFAIIMKTFLKEMYQMIHPKGVRVIRFEGKKVEHNVLRSINTFFAGYILVFVISIILIGLNDFDLITNFTSVVAALNNIGAGLELVGPKGNFGDFSVLSKLVLSFDMLAGRLELFPMLLLFVPSTWKK